MAPTASAGSSFRRRRRCAAPPSTLRPTDPGEPLIGVGEGQAVSFGGAVVLVENRAAPVDHRPFDVDGAGHPLGRQVVAGAGGLVEFEQAHEHCGNQLCDGDRRFARRQIRHYGRRVCAKARAGLRFLICKNRGSIDIGGSIHLGRIYQHGADLSTWSGSIDMGRSSASPQGVVGPHRSLTCAFGYIQGVETLAGQRWPNTIAMRSARTRARGAPVGRVVPDPRQHSTPPPMARDADPRWARS